MSQEEPEFAATDDAVIGRVFRWSVGLLLIIGIGVAVAMALSGPENEVQLVEPPEVVLPRHQESAVRSDRVAFTDIAAAAGIDFVHFGGAAGKKYLPETMGGGCAVIDFDRDGALDLYFVNATAWDGQGTTTGKLYRGDGHGKFSDVTAAAGLDESFYGVGVAAGDFDGDGWVDLYVTAVGTNRLYHNEAGQRFTDVTDAAGVAGEPGAWSTSAGFFDGDGDGDLDLFVCNYVEWSREIDESVNYQLTGIGKAYGPPTNFAGAQSYYFVNQGDGSFQEQARQRGLHVDGTQGPVGKALAVTPVDVDEDGRLDLLVANDTVRNFYFHAEADGNFVERGELIGLAYNADGQATGAMGIDAADYRADHSLAVGIGNFANEMTSLYVLRRGEPLFVDESITEGIGAPSRQQLSFGLFFFDYDLDGRLDLLQANGHLEEQINVVQASQSYRQPVQLFWNTGRTDGPLFTPADVDGDLGRPIVGRGATYGDLDGDGDPEVIVTQVAGPPLILRNDQDLGHHWLRVRLGQPGPNRDAIGARVELMVGDRVLRRRVMPTRSYLSQVELPVTFGLGDSDEKAELRVIWPDGVETQVPVEGLDRLQVIDR